jgi:hypothetical protein
MRRLLLIITILIFSALATNNVSASDGTLLLEPAAGSYPVNGVFSVKIKINSDGTTINAARATVSFPADLLSVQSISKLGSIFQLWPEEPTFSNSNGTIDFAGGIPAPGFNGAGLIATINFKAKKAGTANPNIISGQILAADGRGTDILSFLKGATYVLYPVIEETPEEPKTPEEPEKETKTPVNELTVPVPAPEILLYPKYHISGEELFYVEGKALIDSTVIIYLKKNDNIVKTWETPSDKNGQWIFSTDELIKAGDYILTAKTKTKDGELSSFSAGYKVNVKFPGFSIGHRMIIYSDLLIFLIIFVIIIALIFILIILLKTKQSKERLKKETKEAKDSLENTFIDLGKTLARKIEYLDQKSGLNPQERKLRDEIFYLLKNSEEIVSKEINDIKKELGK